MWRVRNKFLVLFNSYKARMLRFFMCLLTSYLHAEIRKVAQVFMSMTETMHNFSLKNKYEFTTVLRNTITLVFYQADRKSRNTPSTFD